MMPNDVTAGKWKKILVPNAAAFIASFCIMVVELIAGRIVARYLGASLYTWTSVIGIVLVGIALGNYLGGYLADRFPAKKILSAFFILASVSCLIVPLLNRLVGELYIFWLLPWPMRITVHVICVFILPSLMLGVVGPVIAKFALDYGLSVGRTVGNVYACSALGGILGTFITGFLLIPNFGTIFMIISIAVILALISVFFFASTKLSFSWAIAILIIALIPTFAYNLGLREEAEALVIYEKESPYSYIQIRNSKTLANVRKLIIDRLLHSVVNMDNPADIEADYQYPYMKLYAGVTGYLAENKKDLQAMIIGGGGYVLPRYLQKHWPDSSIDVVEIDPEVTKAAIKAFGFIPNSSIKIHHMDGRNFIDESIRGKDESKDFIGYDFIYCDAVSGIAVPYQLTTLEFNKKIRGLLGDSGVYMITTIDSLHSGKFLGAILSTLDKTFEYVYVFSAQTLTDSDYARDTFVVINSKQPIDFTGIEIDNFYGVQLTREQIKTLKEKAGYLVLTDDYAPVDSLLEPIVYQRGLEMASTRLTNIGNDLFKGNRLYQAKDYYYRALSIYPLSLRTYNNLGNVLARIDKPDEAIKNYQQAIKIAPRFSEAYANIATVLARKGELEEAIKYYQQSLKIDPDFMEAYYNLASVYTKLGIFDEAVENYNKALEINPDLALAYLGLADIFAIQNKVNQAIKHYQEALRLEPDLAKAHNNLGIILSSQGRIDEAIAHFHKAIESDPNYQKAEENLQLALSQRDKALEVEGVMIDENF